MHLPSTDHTLAKVDDFAREQKSAAFAVISQNAALPALKDREPVFWESNAILQCATGWSIDRPIRPHRRQALAAPGSGIVVSVLRRLSDRELRQAAVWRQA